MRFFSFNKSKLVNPIFLKYLEVQRFQLLNILLILCTVYMITNPLRNTYILLIESIFINQMNYFREYITFDSINQFF